MPGAVLRFRNALALETANDFYNDLVANPPSGVTIENAKDLRSTASINSLISGTNYGVWTYDATADCARHAQAAFPTSGEGVYTVDATFEAGDATFILTKDAGGTYSGEVGDSILVGTEVINITNWSANVPNAGKTTITACTRGYDGTAAAQHVAGAKAYLSSNTTLNKLTMPLTNGDMAYGYTYAFIRDEYFTSSFLKVGDPNITESRRLVSWKHHQMARGGNADFTLQDSLFFNGETVGGGTASGFNANSHIGTWGIAYFGANYDGNASIGGGPQYRMGPNGATGNDHHRGPHTDYPITHSYWKRFVKIIEMSATDGSDWCRWWDYVYGEDDSAPTTVYDGIQFGMPNGNPIDGTWPNENNSSVTAYQASPGRQQRTLVHGLRNVLVLRSPGTITTSGITASVVSSRFLKRPIRVGALT